MKKTLIKFVLLLGITGMFLSSCSVEYRQHHPHHHWDHDHRGY